MQFKTVVASAISLLAASASAGVAVPRQLLNSTITADSKFTLMSVRSGSELQYAPLSAALNSAFLKLPAQNATCDGTDSGSATFYLKDGGLYLYSTAAPTQQFYSDRSGMGQGLFGFTTEGVEGKGLPLNGETTTFAVDESGNLNLNGAGFIACPFSTDGGWVVAVDVGSSMPMGRDGCVGVALRAVEATDPVSCRYTDYTY